MNNETDYIIKLSDENDSDQEVNKVRGELVAVVVGCCINLWLDIFSIFNTHPLLFTLPGRKKYLGTIQTFKKFLDPLLLVCMFYVMFTFLTYILVWV